MKKSKRIAFGALLAVAVIAAVIFAPSMSANPNVDKTKPEKALEYISQKYGLPKEQLMVTNEKEANFALSNQKIWSVNILDQKNKKFYYVDLDEAGNVADIKAAKALEYAKYKEKYGKKEIALYEKLQKMNPEDTVEVGIWLSPIISEPKPSLFIKSKHSLFNPSSPQISVVSPTINTQKSERGVSEKEYKEIMDAKRKAYAEKEKPVLDMLEAKNINVRYASQYAPLIYAEVPVKLMAEVENIPEVDGIYLAREFEPLMDKVASTVRVQPVWNAGITGSGINVAVVEHGKINESHPNLPTVTAYNHSEVNSSHATQVAGIVATINNATYKGISYGVPGLLSANFGGGYPATEESRAINASEWAINNGANILSNSWGNDTNGVLSGIDKYFDYVVWENWRTVTVAAGNNYPGENWRVTSPGLGFNVITVGGFEDNSTLDWSDDKMWADSAYVDPRSRNDDREKPEVAAVATHNSTTGIYITSTSVRRPPTGYPIESTSGSGTSYAAPAVAGEAALLMQADYNLTIWPEVVKAIIMASADHNIEGASKLSEKDGAGGIDIDKIFDTGAIGMVTDSSYFPIDFGFDVSAGQKVRIVIVWDSHPDSNQPPQNDDLKSDLNLVVYNPSGAMVDKSDSYDNSYEIAEFTATSAGTYHAVVYAKTFSDPYEYLGFAVTYV